MDDDPYRITITDSLGPVQMPVFGLLLLVLVGATIILICKRACRSRISVSLVVLGIAIFFYAGALEALGLAYDHEDSMRTGNRNPQVIDELYAEFYVRLWAFRSLSTFALTVSAIGLATSKPEPANKGRQATASRSPAT